MIIDDHDVPDAERGVDAAGGVGEEEGPDAKLLHHPDGEGYLLGAVTLVIMEAALHGYHFFSSEITEDQFPGMTLHRGDREFGYLSIGNLDLIVNFGGEAAQAGAQHYTRLRVSKSF